MTAKRQRSKPRTIKTLAGPEALLPELRELILAARSRVAIAVNTGLTLLYWQLGDRIRREILKERRAEYGAEIVSALGRQLEQEFGRGFSPKSLHHMIRFAEAFPDSEIVFALVRDLSWTHFKILIYLDDSLKRDFYAQMCRIERWSTRTLQERIQSMTFERTALSKKPQNLIEQELKALRQEDLLTPDLVFRDPYLLDFLGLRTPMAKRIWKTLCCARSSPSSWSSASALPSSNARSASRWTATTTTWISCSTIAACGVWWSSS